MRHVITQAMDMLGKDGLMGNSIMRHNALNDKGNESLFGAITDTSDGASTPATKKGSRRTNPNGDDPNTRVETQKSHLEQAETKAEAINKEGAKAKTLANALRGSDLHDKLPKDLAAYSDFNCYYDFPPIGQI